MAKHRSDGFDRTAAHSEAAAERAERGVRKAVKLPRAPRCTGKADCKASKHRATCLGVGHSSH